MFENTEGEDTHDSDAENMALRAGYLVGFAMRFPDGSDERVWLQRAARSLALASKTVEESKRRFNERGEEIIASAKWGHEHEIAGAAKERARIATALDAMAEAGHGGAGCGCSDFECGLGRAADALREGKL